VGVTRDVLQQFNCCAPSDCPLTRRSPPRSPNHKASFPMADRFRQATWLAGVYVLASNPCGVNLPIDVDAATRPRRRSRVRRVGVRCSRGGPSRHRSSPMRDGIGTWEAPGKMLFCQAPYMANHCPGFGSSAYVRRSRAISMDTRHPMNWLRMRPLPTGIACRATLVETEGWPAGGRSPAIRPPPPGRRCQLVARAPHAY
jgi:hypothetical protein